jgi:hypothetical protein
MSGEKRTAVADATAVEPSGGANLAGLSSANEPREKAALQSLLQQSFRLPLKTGTYCMTLVLRILVVRTFWLMSLALTMFAFANRAAVASLAAPAGEATLERVFVVDFAAGLLLMSDFLVIAIFVSPRMI